MYLLLVIISAAVDHDTTVLCHYSFLVEGPDYRDADGVVRTAGVFTLEIVNVCPFATTEPTVRSSSDFLYIYSTGIKSPTVSGPRDLSKRKSPCTRLFG